jgi:hypothetical protein
VNFLERYVNPAFDATGNWLSRRGQDIRWLCTEVKDCVVEIDAYLDAHPKLRKLGKVALIAALTLAFPEAKVLKWAQKVWAVV